MRFQSTRRLSFRFPRTLAGGACLAPLAATLLGGCSGSFLPQSTSARFTSADSEVFLSNKYPHRAYTYRDTNTADIYLSDIDPQELASPNAAARATGEILHLHLFIRPYPGNTPIEASAVTATARYVVFAEGAAGVYSGGGFLFPSGQPTGKPFRGRMPSATLALSHATPGFHDPIGRGSMEASFKAPYDLEAAEIMRDVVDRVVLDAATVEPLTYDELIAGVVAEMVALAQDAETEAPADDPVEAPNDDNSP